MCDNIDLNNCENCDYHKARCLKLEQDVSELTQKLNRLLAAEFYGKTESSCQTQSVIFDSICTQTSHAKTQLKHSLEDVLAGKVTNLPGN